MNGTKYLGDAIDSLVRVPASICVWKCGACGVTGWIVRLVKEDVGDEAPDFTSNIDYAKHKHIMFNNKQLLPLRCLEDKAIQLLDGFE